MVRPTVSHPANVHHHPARPTTPRSPSRSGRARWAIIPVLGLAILLLGITLAYRPFASADTPQDTEPATLQAASSTNQKNISQPEFHPVAYTPATLQQAATSNQVRDALKERFENARPIAFDFPKDAEWLNTSGKIRMDDLKGKFVLFDFWTYCCINCMHILPVLRQLEETYPDQIVVIGIHSAKFETEKNTQNIREAILRYEIQHPVVNDPDQKIWRQLGVQSWPTLVLFDPEGNVLGVQPGEIRYEDIEPMIKEGIKFHRKKKTLDETPLRFELAAFDAPETPLRFPGKVLADEELGQLFITDSNHNRIVISDMQGKLLDIIGNGKVGLDDGDYATATFDHPQGLVRHGDWLYVADTENHALRKVNLVDKQVTTITGNGNQAESGFPGLARARQTGRLPKRWVGPVPGTELNSPWALWVHADDLYIAMAGPHQIWKMPLNESTIGPYAGNGREDIVDGTLLPETPYDNNGFSSFAQPSGLASDGEWLYVADSEGSSIRAVPLDGKGQVGTLVGTSSLPFNRLFTFGDRDGARKNVLLQHVLGITYHDNQLFIADTYNNKIKVVDAKTGETKTLAGDGKPGLTDQPARFDEPAGVSYAGGKLYVADTNNHLIRVVDPASGTTSTLNIEGLTPPEKPAPPKPDFADAEKITVENQTVSVVDGKATFNVEIDLPILWKINPVAEMTYYLSADQDSGVVPADNLPQTALTIDPPSGTFPVTVPVSGEGSGKFQLSLIYYYCQDGGEGLCKVGSVVWDVQLTTTDQPGKTGTLSLSVKP